MEDLKASFVVAALAAGTIMAGCLLLYIAVKIIMANEINRNGYLFDLDEEDDEENGNSDNKLNNL